MGRGGGECEVGCEGGWIWAGREWGGGGGSGGVGGGLAASLGSEQTGQMSSACTLPLRIQ